MSRLSVFCLAALSVAASSAAAQPAAPSAVVSPEPLAPPAADTASADTTADHPALVWAEQAAETRRRVQAEVAATTVEGQGAAFRDALAEYHAGGASAGGASAGGASVGGASGSAVALSFPAEAAPLVERQRGIVASRFAAAVQRGRRFLPMIVRALTRRGLPAELQYVALIESSLNPAATSPAGAAGLWQLMPGTAADFGLDASGARDPQRSTDAAVRFLDGLGRQFDGDWQLALAAYNCGPARVRRLVMAYEARTGETPTFWDLRAQLPAETRDYVVRFIAAAQHFAG